ncbi:MAG: hypothetical protein JO157_09305 [Acetobacteraceae bacterium]|nr:hypothetical protein [Acetobacteraceae bacterium]
MAESGTRTEERRTGFRPASLAMLGALLCGGCTARYVSGEAIASNKAVESETNSILVTNILRARDGVPTYYSDISHLRGSMQAQASLQAPLGVGDYKNWTGRSLISPGAYVQVNPSFDIAPLNTQGFTKGINEPLDIRVFQYYLDRAIPPYTLLELFVDKIEDVHYENGRASITPYYNIPCDATAPECGLRSSATGERYFDAKIRAWTHPYLFLNAYKLLLPYGPPFVVGAGKDAPTLRDFGGVASNPNLTLRAVGGTASRTYRFYTVSNNVAFCVSALVGPKPGQGGLDVTIRNQDGAVESTRAYQVVRVARNTVGNAASTVSESVDPTACVKSEVYADYEAPRASGSYTVLHFRSVDGMIEFLGRMLRVPPHLRPLRFEISPDDPATSRFAVPYGDRNYYVHDRRHRLADVAGCPQANTDPRCEDRTLEILTLVNQLLNLNKNESELPSTAAVQVVN